MTTPIILPELPVVATSTLIVNFTQHQLTADQLEAGAIEPPSEYKERIKALLTFDSLPAKAELEERAEKLADLMEAAVGETMERENAPTHVVFCSVLIGGAPYFMPVLERVMLGRGLTPVYAFSRRESVEETLPDGTVKKSSVFKHAGWIEID